MGELVVSVVDPSPFSVALLNLIDLAYDRRDDPCSVSRQALIDALVAVDEAVAPEPVDDPDPLTEDEREFVDWCRDWGKRPVIQLLAIIDRVAPTPSALPESQQEEG